MLLGGKQLQLQTIENRDAILDLSDPKHPAAAKWPEADYIIGNPPFLGSKLFRKWGLPESYVCSLFAAYDLPKSSDLCCYWFELARRSTSGSSQTRVGLLATQGIRGGASREVLHRIKHDGDIFMAWSDREWILDGAAVNVSIIGFDSGTERTRTLDGTAASAIHADLGCGLDLTNVRKLPEMASLSFQGPVKVGSFDIPWYHARQILTSPNPNGVPNHTVVLEWIRGEALVSRVDPMWIIDFCEMEMSEACRYEAPFDHVLRTVKPEREHCTDKQRKTYWWRLGRSGADFRRAVGSSERYVVTCQTAKHRLFTWAATPSLPAQTVIAFGRSDDYFLGVLQSAVHLSWAAEMGTQLEDRPRYTPSTCFETFAAPWPPGKENEKRPAYKRISDAAKELNDMRERWLNPPEWIEPIAQNIDATEQFLDVPEKARPLIRHSAIMAAAAKDPKLKKRTLTNLYNERPTWLKLAHEKLDRAVLAAYAATDPQGHWSEDWAQVFTDSGPGQPLPPNHPLTQQRADVEKKILENLLRLNHERARA